MDNKSKNQTVIAAIKGLTLKDAGYKPPKSKKGLDSPCCTSSANGIIYPSLYFNSNQVPDLKGYEVGDEVTMVIRGKVTSHSLNESSENKRETFDLEVHQVACAGKTK